MHRSPILVCLAAMLSCGCRRSPTSSIAPVSSTPGIASSVPRPSGSTVTTPPLGSPARLVGTPWGACVITTTSQVWCFSALNDKPVVVPELQNVVLLEGGLFEDYDIHRDPMVSCEAVILCAVTSARTLECTSNLKSPSLVTLAGPVVDGKRQPPASAACAGVPTGKLAEGALWMGPLVAPIWDGVGAMCDNGFGMSREGLLVGLATEAIIVPAVRKAGSTCCKINLGGTYGPKCKVGPDRCSIPYPDGAPASWHFGVGRMGDGSFRHPPLESSDEVKSLKGATSVVYDSYVACALDTGGIVRCSNEPYDGPCADGAPAYRKWHRVEGIGAATAILVAESAAGGSVACALVQGRPWCWGTDGPEDASGPSALGILGTGKLDRCIVKTGNMTTRHFCRRTPTPVEGVQDLVEVVAMGAPRVPGVRSGGGICGRTSGGQIVCWGPETHGVAKFVPEPAK